MDTTEKIIDQLGIKELNPMQTEALESFKAPNDLILLSPTGTGKTLAFLLPIAQSINPNVHKVQVIVIAPSRELALQIEQVFKSMQTGLKVNSLYGGHSMKIEKQNLSEPAKILIGTPGRIADHIDRETFDTNYVQTLVLDEFDKSLEFGFSKEMGFILRKLKSISKKVLTSATRMETLPDFVKLNSPKTIDYIKEAKTTKLTLKKVTSPDKDKLYTLLKLLCYTGNEATLVFINHREASDRISAFLNENGIINDAFHGGMEQLDREIILTKFRNGSSKLLITTDLAARGLDIPEIRYIIHYHLPSTEAAFTHRNGRTARMNANGTAFVLVSEDEKTPDYLPAHLDEFGIPKNLEKPTAPNWVTISFNKGKKDKVNKIDVVGFLSKQGELDKDDIGLIEVKDFFSFAAINRAKSHALLKKIKDQKIKGKQARILLL